MAVEHPTVTVLMAEYRTPLDVFDEGVRSVVSQSLNDFELIVVDDSHDQHATEWCRRYHDPRIRVVPNGKNLGFVASLNHGIEEARGKWVVRTDTDEVCRPDRLAQQLAFVTKNPEYSAIGSCAVEMGDGQVFGVGGYPGELSMEDLIAGKTPLHSSMMLLASTLRQYGYPNYDRAEDLALWFEMLLGGERIYIMRETLIARRLDADDFRKRRLSTRGGELRARKHYYREAGYSRAFLPRAAKSVIASVASRTVLANRFRGIARKQAQSGNWPPGDLDWYQLPPVQE